MSLKYGVIGSGAIGGYYGGMLAKAGKDVHFLFHSDYEYVKEHGLQIDSIHGDFRIQPIQAYNNTKDMPKCDVVLVGLKSTNNKILKEILPPLLHKNTLVILIQNGLGLEADVAQDFPDTDIAGAMAFICSSKIGEGRIKHMDEGTINIGSYSCKNTALLNEVNADFCASGVDSSIVDLEAARWRKLLWNIPFNGMSVVLNATTKQLLSNKATRQLLHDMMMEVVQAANCIGEGKFSLPEKIVDKMLAMTDKMPPYAPSMKLDFDYHRPLEIEYIYSHPILEARKAGYEMTRTQMLEQQLHFIQSQYLK